MTNRLRITEIFHSLQGESSTVGLPTIFIRLTGCPLRCGYCDTAYAFQGGQWLEQEEILEKVSELNASYVTVTGGEPLAQKPVQDLMRVLCDQGYRVSLETSGALDIIDVDPRVMVVMDLKTPSSGECERNLYQNIAHLKKTDQIKFVICNRADYDWAKEMLRAKNLPHLCEILFSPVAKDLPPADLADWILQDHLPVRFQLQLHKVLWGDVAGR